MEARRVLLKSNRDAGFKLLRVSIAVLVGLAAIAKLHLFVLFGSVGGLSAELLIPLVVFELGLCWWMFTCQQLTRLWAVVAILLTCSTLYHIVAGVVGLESCMCFAQLTPTRPVMACLMGTALVLWFIFRPLKLSAIVHDTGAWKIKTEGVGTFLGLLVFSLCGVYAHQTGMLRPVASPQDGWVNLRPNRIVLDGLAADSTVDIRIEIENVSDFPAELVGGGVSCGCVTLQEFPVSIESNSRAEFVIRYTPLKADAGKEWTEKRFRYYLDHPYQKSLDGVIYSKVAAAK